jgi:hypothetical protein
VVLPAGIVNVPVAVTTVIAEKPGLVLSVPLELGNVRTVVPATAGAWRVTEPDVSPAITTELIVYSC